MFIIELSDLKEALVGVSQFAVVYCLMKQAKALGAYKIAKQAVTLLQNLKIPAQFQESVDVSTIHELLRNNHRCYVLLIISSVDFQMSSWRH